MVWAMQKKKKRRRNESMLKRIVWAFASPRKIEEK
jgi:hypothetical protein